MCLWTDESKWENNEYRKILFIYFDFILNIENDMNIISTLNIIVRIIVA